MEYHVVSAGVNAAAGPFKVLKWAEKDATDIATFMTSAQGPLTGQSVVPLLGGAATRRSILSAIRDAGLVSDWLLVYFSGHGTDEGIATADGILDYQKIVRVIDAVGPPHTMVILDVCQAASYLDYFLKEAQMEIGGLEGLVSPSWLEALAEATPSMRLAFSSGRDRTSAESARVANGHFTHSLLQVLKRAAGDLASDTEEHTWISDECAFAMTRAVMREVFGDDQEAAAYNLTGDFPLARSQADTPIGDASFMSARLDAGQLSVEAFIVGRQALDTRIRWDLFDTLGTPLEKGQTRVRPRVEFARSVAKFPLPRDLSKYATVRRQILRSGAANLVAVLRLEDATGREYDRRVLRFTYR